MAKIFLDTNYFLDIVWRNTQKSPFLSSGDNQIYISILSVHIYAYSAKIKIPDQNLVDELKKFIILDLNEKILNMAITGPTTDLEDNIQLHSAAEADCDLFLTNDKALLKMTFFGKTRLLERP